MKNILINFIKLCRGLLKLQQFCFVERNVKIGKNVKVGLFTSIEENCIIGNNTFIGNGCTLRPHTEIGNNCSFGHLTVIEGYCKIGNRVSFHAQCHITKGTIVEDDVFLAPFYLGTNTKTIDHGRNINPPVEAPMIKRAARIGAAVTILPGVIIGENSLIGAGSVVTKNIPDNEIWFGNPARKRGTVLEENRIYE